MKKIYVIIMALVLTATLTACGNKSCADCERMAELQAKIAELQVYERENRNDEGSDEYESKLEELAQSIKNYELYAMHECELPVTEVKDKDFCLSNLAGTYTGEWKGSAPYGHGVYTALDSSKVEEYSAKYVFDCEWKFGLPEGFGKKTIDNEDSITPYYEYYEGYFVNGLYEGEGFLRKKTLNSTMEVTGTFKENNLSGQAEFVEYDNSGNMIDYGIVEGPQMVKIQSAKRDQEEEQSRRQQEMIEQGINNVIDGLVDFLW